MSGPHIHNIFHRPRTVAGARWVPASGVFGRFRVASGEVCETGGIVQESQVELPDRAVALFGDDDLGLASKLGIVLFVDLFAEDKNNNVRVLLDGAGFAEIA